MITFPTSVAEALAAKGEYRAGSTDLSERRHIGIAKGDLVDLRDVGGLDSVVAHEGGGWKIGAKVRLSDLAEAEPIRGYPALREAAGGLATPQIRAVATLGGNLLQRTRCWYYRAPEAHCLKKGGSECKARGGDHLFHACFDLGPCASVHPSTLGMALMAYDAQVEVEGTAPRTVAELFGDGSDPTRDNQLEDGALLTAVILPPPAGGERSAYFRATSRARAEWPLVEVAARLMLEGETIRSAAVAIGGVAPVPLRLPNVEAALAGKAAKPATLSAAAKLAASGAKPLPMTGYKVGLVVGTVLEGLERALERDPVPAAAPPAKETTP